MPCLCLQGQALNEVAHPECKVLVVGNPCNTNALIAMENAPRLDRRNFHALTRLDENRAKCQLALKAERFYTSVTNTCIWGNHSTTQVGLLLGLAFPYDVRASCRSVSGSISVTTTCILPKMLACMTDNRVKRQSVLQKRHPYEKSIDQALPARCAGARLRERPHRWRASPGGHR